MNEEVLLIFSEKIQNILQSLTIEKDKLQEIRLRVEEPLIVLYENQEYFVDCSGNMIKERENTYIVSKQDIEQTLDYMSQYSLYAYEDEIRQGFLTIQGGHRVGLAGKIVMEGDKIKNVKHISFLNVRLAHQKKGCANKILPYIFHEGKICHTMIISPPGCGKTTLLRDIIRLVSDGTKDRQGLTVGVVDERGEIGACYHGVPQNDLGVRTDVLDCCPKSLGMLMLLRSMSPKVIAVDEIGTREDLESIEYVLNCGCKLIATVHGKSISDIKKKPVIRKLLDEKMFDRYIILSGKREVGTIENIFDSMGNPLFREKVK